MTDQEVVMSVRSSMSRSQSDVSVVRIREALEEFQGKLEISQQRGEKIDRANVLNDLCQVMSSVMGNEAGRISISAANDEIKSKETKPSSESNSTIRPIFLFEQSRENNTQVTTVNLNNEGEILQLRMTIDEDDQSSGTTSMNTEMSGVTGENTVKNKDSTVCIDVDNQDTVEIQHELLPSEVIQRKQQDCGDTNTESKVSKWFPFKKKPKTKTPKKKGVTRNELDKSRSFEVAKGPINKMENAKNLQREESFDQKKDYNEVNDLALDSVGGSVERESSIINRLRSFPSLTRKKQQEKNKNRPVELFESEDLTSMDTETTTNLENILQMSVDTLIDEECIDSTADTSEESKDEIKKEAPKPITPKKSRSIASFLTSRSKLSESSYQEDIPDLTPNTSVDTSLDSSTHLTIVDKSIEILVMDKDAVRDGKEVISDNAAYISKSTNSVSVDDETDSDIVSLTLSKPLGLIFEEVTKSFASGVVLKEIRNNGSAHKFENSQIFPGMKLVSVMDENVEFYCIKDIMDAMICSPSPVSIKLRHTSSSKKYKASKTKKNRVFFKSLKKKIKTKDIQSNPSSKKDLPLNTTDHKSSEELSETISNLTKARAEDLFERSDENVSICSDGDTKSQENSYRSETSGRRSSFPGRNDAEASLSSFNDDSVFDHAFKYEKESRSCDHHPLGNRKNSFSTASYLSEPSADRSVRRCKTTSSLIGGRSKSKNSAGSIQTIEESPVETLKSEAKDQGLVLPPATSPKIRHNFALNGNEEEYDGDDYETNKDNGSVSTYSTMLRYRDDTSAVTNDDDCETNKDNGSVLTYSTMHRYHDDTSAVTNRSNVNFVTRMVACVDNIVIEEGEELGEELGGGCWTPQNRLTYDDGDTHFTSRMGHSSFDTGGTTLISRIENSDSGTLVEQRSRSLFSDSCSIADDSEAVDAGGMKHVGEDHDREVASMTDDYEDDTSEESTSAGTWQLTKGGGLCAM